VFAHFDHDPGSGLGIAFTDRHGGVSLPPFDTLNLGRSDLDDPTAVVENLRRVRDGIGLAAGRPVVTVRQEHTAEVLVVDETVIEHWDDLSPIGDAAPGRPRLARADAMVTGLRGVALCIRVADCLPVLLADAAAGVVAAVHAGRVGLAGQILPNAVRQMRTMGATAPVAWIGPSVCGGCYEVPVALRDEVDRAVPGSAATTTWGTPSLDLAAGAERQLSELGCPVTRIGGCTRTSSDLYSHRRDGADAGRLAGVVWLS